MTAPSEASMKRIKVALRKAGCVYSDGDDDLVRELSLALDEAVAQERENNIQWVKAFAQVCGCSEKIEAAIRSAGSQA